MARKQATKAEIAARTAVTKIPNATTLEAVAEDKAVRTAVAAVKEAVKVTVGAVKPMPARKQLLTSDNFRILRDSLVALKSAPKRPLVVVATDVILGEVDVRDLETGKISVVNGSSDLVSFKFKKNFSPFAKGQTVFLAGAHGDADSTVKVVAIYVENDEDYEAGGVKDLKEWFLDVEAASGTYVPCVGLSKFYRGTVTPVRNQETGRVEKEIKAAAKTHAKAAAKPGKTPKAVKTKVDTKNPVKFPTRKEVKSVKDAAIKRLTKPGVVIMSASGLVRVKNYVAETSLIEAVTIQNEIVSFSLFCAAPATKKAVDEYRRAFKLHAKVKAAEFAVGDAVAMKKAPKVYVGKIVRVVPSANELPSDIDVEHSDGSGLYATSVDLVKYTGKIPRGLHVGDAVAYKSTPKTKLGYVSRIDADQGVDVTLVDGSDHDLVGITATTLVLFAGKDPRFDSIPLFSGFIYKDRTHVKVSKSNAIQVVVRGSSVEPFAMLATSTSKLNGSAIKRFKKDDRVRPYLMGGYPVAPTSGK